ncbi:MAG: hypothetical protein KDC46_13100 [Thermoleophilia bacterium]|nr:hypothetical protein [Thermoleophilia bacterium]
MYDASQGAQLIAHEGTHSVMLRGPGVNFNRVQHESLAYHVQARTAFELGERPYSFMVDGDGPASPQLIRSRLELIARMRA